MSASFRRTRLFLFVFLGLVVVAAASLWIATRRIRWDDPDRPPPLLARAVERFSAGDLNAGEKLIRRSLARYRAPAWESRTRVLGAWRLMAAGHDERIGDLLPSPLDPGVPLAAHADLLRAHGYLATKRFRQAAAAASRASSTAGFPGREEALRLQAAALQGDHRFREAMALLLGASSPGLHLEAAKALLARGLRDEARRRFADVVMNASAGDTAERALSALVSSFPDPSSRYTPHERALLPAAARRWKEAGRLQAALDLLRSARPPTTLFAALSCDAALLEADLLVRLGRSGEAPSFLLRAAQGDADAADGARYVRARLDYAQGRAGAYRSNLLALAGRPGRSSWRLLALADLARHEEGKPSEAALVAYRRYRAAAGGDADPVALWREAWIAYELGRESEAVDGIARVLRLPDAPGSVRTAALYWFGRMLEAGGRLDAARSKYREVESTYPNHYYGLLAAARLGIRAPRPREADPPRAPSPASAAARRWLDAARELRSIGLWDEASASYRSAAAAAGKAARSIALEAAREAMDGGEDADAVQLVQLAMGDRDRADLEEFSVRELRLLAPAPGGDVIVRAAGSSKLDPDLVAAVVLQESAFNPIAVSSAGARGLLQLMPDTGAELARRIGLQGFRADRLFEPEVSLRLGCAYLRSLWDELGSLPVALAAYNAGPARAARWLLPGDRDTGERFVERIPLSETRSYVKRVLANASLYRIAYPEGLDHGER